MGATVACERDRCAWPERVVPCIILDPEAASATIFVGHSQLQRLGRAPIPVEIVADGELLHITTVNNQRFIINFRLKDLEARLEPAKFVRLSRGALANLEMLLRVSPMPGGTYLVTLKNNQQIPVSRLQSKILREKLLTI